METPLELIGRIYDSVADPTRWLEFLDALVHASNCTTGTLVLLGQRLEDASIVCWYGLSDEDIAHYVQRYATDDPMREASGRVAEGVLVTSLDLCSEREFEESIAYREFYGPHGLRHSFGGCILRTEVWQSGITLLRGKQAGPCGEYELSILRPLMPHLRRAALLHGELTSLRSQLTAFTDHIDRYPQAFLLTDSDRSVLYLNAAGLEITGRRDGLALEAGRLTIMSPTGDKELRTAVREIASNREAPLRRIVIERPGGKTSYRLLLMPLAGSGMVPLGASRPAVAILIIDAGSPPPLDPDMLRQLFSLTAAEARLAGKLALGWSIEEIAAEGGISVETVRTHIKRVLSKTATARQGELISLILRSVPFRTL